MIKRKSVSIANEMRMMRSTYHGSFLVVEGMNDCLFMTHFIDQKSCKIKIANGKEYVEEIMEILDSDSFVGVLGIVDADFDRIENRDSVSLNIVMPPTHDLDAMMIRSHALEGVLIEYGSQCKIQSLEDSVIDILDSVARFIASFRLYSHQMNLNLRFKNINYSHFVNRHSFEFDLHKLVNEVRNHSQYHEISIDILMDAIYAVNDECYQNDEFCSGTDLLNLLSVGLRGIFGSNSSTDVNPDILRSMFRLAYSREVFDKSELSKNIHHWELKNQNFRILPE